MKGYNIILLGICAMALMGCGNAGMFLAGNTTQVSLEEGNYTIIANNVTGEADKSYLLGVSYTLGFATYAYGLIPLDAAGTLYKEAREELWDQFETAHFPVEGRKLALINVQYDSNNANFLLYTRAKVIITADVIEFE